MQLRILLTLPLALLLVSLGCTRQEQAELAVPATNRLLTPLQDEDWQGLPAPSALTGLGSAGRSGSYLEDDLYQTALAYSGILPSQNVRQAGTRLAFEPTWTTGSSGFESLALAGYVFNIPAFDRTPSIRSEWSTPSADYKSVWLGLANWDTDRWDWYASPADYKVELASIDPYVNLAGSLVLVVLRTGTDLSRLAGVRIGSPLPSAVLSASPKQGPPPLDSLLDASQSSAAEGSIVKYEFDPGDGTFLDNGADPSFESHYEAQGKFTVRVRVTDSQGGQATAQRPVYANGPWTRTWTRDHFDEVLGLALSIDGDIYACGDSANDTLRSQATIWKYDPLGNLLWVRAFSDPGNGRFNSCAVDSGGNLIVCGDNTPSSGQTQGLIQKWSPEGEILWAREFTSGSRTMRPAKVILDADQIYLPGTLTGSSYNHPNDVLMMCVAGDGGLVWANTWGVVGAMQDETIWSGCGRLNPGGSLAGIVAVGSTGFQDLTIPAWEPSPLLVEFDTAGVVVRTWRYGPANLQSYYTAVGITGTDPLSQRITALGTGVGSQLLTRANLDGVVEWNSSLVLSSFSFLPSDLAFSTTSNGVLALGSLLQGASETAVLTSIDSAVAGVIFQRYWPLGGQAYFKTMSTASDGSLFIGGSSFNTSGEFGDLGAGHTGFSFQYETLAGTSAATIVDFAEDNDSSVELQGQLDTITTGRAAMVMHLPPQ